MAVRNFWIEADIDGRKTSLEGGPRSKDGGFNLTVYIRDHGSIAKALRVTGEEVDGKLRLWVEQGDELSVWVPMWERESEKYPYQIPRVLRMETERS